MPTAAQKNTQAHVETAHQPIDVDTRSFAAEVITASENQLVIVDFWAPWCNPCKQLAPDLEQAVAQTKGAAKLVKVNIDTCPQIAQQLRVQSIPAVFAFYNKKIVDGFMGALPLSQITQWLAELVAATGATAPVQKEDFTSAITQANDFLVAGNTDTAFAIFSDILEEQPDNIDAFSGLLKTLIAKGDLENALDRLAQAPASIADHKDLASVRASLDLAQATKSCAENLDALAEAALAAPQNYQAKFDYAQGLYGAGQVETALAQLLDIVREDRKWNEDGARKQVLKILETLDFDHPVSVATRKQLSTILFS